jgi:hypothetical protein
VPLAPDDEPDPPQAGSIRREIAINTRLAGCKGAFVIHIFEIPPFPKADQGVRQQDVGLDESLYVFIGSKKLLVTVFLSFV